MAPPASPAVVAPAGGAWPPARGSSVVLLADGATPLEEELIAAYAERLRGDGVDSAVATDGDAASREAESRSAPIAPVRLLWLPTERDGDRRHGVRELTLAAGPARLRSRSQRRTLDRDSSRARIVVGQPAALDELQTRWAERTGGDTDGDFGAFVERQAAIALERTERRLLGERYRAPHRVVEELATSPIFVGGTEQIARDLGREPAGVLADARAYLEEMATEQQRLARDLWTSWARFLYSRGYELHVDTEGLEKVRKLGERHPLVFLPSHRSNLDGYVMASLLHEHGMAPNHTLGGINMAFWPLGALGRRVGVIWIRRSFRDNEIYKFTLRRYLGYLVSKRFNLEWYIEGGRSRTGKLLPPRLGLFNYLADAVEELDIEAVHVIPVSIVYDELQEAHEMTSESRGTKKDAEGLGWLLRFAREQRGSFGGVHVNFGEPIELAAALKANGSEGPDGDPAARRLARSKVAFEVCTRINRATPVTATSLVTLALLGDGDRAATLDEIAVTLEPLRRYVEARALPGAEACAALGQRATLEETLRTLGEHGVIDRFDDGPEPVFSIGPDHELVAAFYRNATIHWFVARAIVELALVKAAADRVDDATAVALEDAFALRDLLKFEFFFPEKEAYRTELRDELSLIDPAWQAGGDEGLTALGAALADSGALMAHRVLRSFVEAYSVVADHLESLGSSATDAAAAGDACLGRGAQYRLQRRVAGAEAVSKHLFEGALKLAKLRGLLDQSGPEVAAGRFAFAAELRDVLARLQQIDALDRAGAAVSPVG